MYKNETIAAISTPFGTGGVGIIRISGPDSFEIAERIFKCKKDFRSIKSHTINYGKIIDPASKSIIDEVLVSKMRSPNTYTKEDVVEINCHGGITVQKEVLRIVTEQGAKIAEPGEFTKRAFLNGRLDLSQAEAVIDIINSKTFESSKAAVKQLEGKLSQEIKAARTDLIGLLAHIEVTVDYPEHDIEEITGEKVAHGLKAVEAKLEKIIKGFDKGRILREGITVVIAGMPNVGKSSLLNELAGHNKAIVTDIPGTTRDVIEEYINIKGIPVRILDTAGIRETEDLVEKIGVKKAEKEIEKADLIIYMIDAVKGIDYKDEELINAFNKNKSVIILNKTDLTNETHIEKTVSLLEGFETVKMSVKEGKGITELEEFISSRYTSGEAVLDNEILLTNIRHKELIDGAVQSIREAMNSYDNGMPLDMITIDIIGAADSLGRITGETVSEDVMNEIFKKFCIGK